MLTPLELDIMKAVWNHPSATVKDVQIAIRPRRKLAYTTVMTIMHRLYQKRFLNRELKARAHIYHAAVRYDQVRDAEVGRLVDEFFAGSRDNLIGFLGGEQSEEIPRMAVNHPSADLDDTLL
jgi:predicted transcriptional regulator